MKATKEKKAEKAPEKNGTHYQSMTLFGRTVNKEKKKDVEISYIFPEVSQETIKEARDEFEAARAKHRSNVRQEELDSLLDDLEATFPKTGPNGML